MKYYLLKEAERIKNPDIQDYNQVINYQAFRENKSYQMSQRNVCIVNNEADFGNLLFTPFPLFRGAMKESLDRFVWDVNYKDVIFLTKDRSKSFEYYLPFFWRITAACSWDHHPEGRKRAMIALSEPVPDDIPICYLETGKKLLLMARLDLLESLLRKGLCGIELIPVDFKGDTENE